MLFPSEDFLQAVEAALPAEAVLLSRPFVREPFLGYHHLGISLRLVELDGDESFHRGLLLPRPGVDQPLGSLDLPEGPDQVHDIALRRLHAEAIAAAGSQIDRGARQREAGRPPPLLEQLCLGERGEHALARRGKRPGNAQDLGRCRVVHAHPAPPAGRLGFRGDFAAGSSRNLARDSNCWLQNSAYSAIQPAALRIGAATSCSRWTRPSRWRLTRPASSSTRRCLPIAGGEIETGADSSPTEASPRASRVRTARRVGWLRAEKTVSRVADLTEW